MKQPNNIILIVVDSLRYDSTFQDGHSGLNYAEKNAISFTQARSSGCWTLPSTASVFTGLMPHQHQTTSQTRCLPKQLPTLAEKLKAVGYQPIQITGNMVTTDLFGLDRGFDATFKIWNHVQPRLNKLTRFIMLLSRPRVRKEVLDGGFFNAKKASQYLNAGNVWAQCTYHDLFAKAREILAENEKRAQKNFLFLNVMETHFPYHVDRTFRLSTNSLPNMVQETTGLYHTVNQSFLKGDHNYIKPRAQRILKNRQRKSWRLIRKDLDEFIRELHEDKNNLVILCADHGDNFGDQGWFYHFANVTDGGNRVPLFWLGHDHPGAKVIDRPVSLTLLFNSILKACNVNIGESSLFEDNPDTTSIMQSYWYDNHGKTLAKYKFNQFCFIDNNTRYLLKKNRWYRSPITQNYPEEGFSSLPHDVNPVEECISDADKSAFLKRQVADFEKFSAQLLPARNK
ncbi:sulfatase-like hydrolase/transferase [candidate division KSB1 bacterium]|nr:sulfatase-like hydrolase/transferase [candidate division KSB1 bacterium]